MAATLLDRLFGNDPPGEPDTAPAPPAPPPPADHALRAVLATKILHGWAQNRQQVLVPLTLRLGWLEPDRRALIVQAMAAALAACGVPPASAEARLAAALRQAGGEPGTDTAALADLPGLVALVAALEAAKLGAHGYAAAALVLDRRVPVERAFLDWLAARFALPPSLTAGLARRYRR